MKLNVPEPESIEFFQRKAEDRELFNFLIEDFGIGPVDEIDAVWLCAKSSNKL